MSIPFVKFDNYDLTEAIYVRWFMGEDEKRAIGLISPSLHVITMYKPECSFYLAFGPNLLPET